MNNQIEKQIELKAPISKVWQALTDYKQFGEWFGVEVEGPFEEGKTVEGEKIKACGSGESAGRFTATVQTLNPEHFFSYTWRPYNPEQDDNDDTQTLVEFKLTESPAGTVLKVIESGFDKLPANRREVAYRMHTDGWTAQLESIKDYLADKATV